MLLDKSMMLNSIDKTTVERVYNYLKENNTTDLIFKDYRVEYSINYYLFLALSYCTV